MNARLWSRNRARSVALVFALAWIAASQAALLQAQPPAEAMPREELREQILARYDVIALSRGLGLVPKSRPASVRLIEITEDGVAVDGQIVTGQELRSRLGAAAAAVIQLTYLPMADQRKLLGLTGADVPATPAPPEPSSRPPESEQPPRPGADRRARRGDRVRVFHDVIVERNESVRGDAVAVLGSARIDGQVAGDVVAVMGSVQLGPEARVNGDAVAVGGEVRRATGSEVRGEIVEVAFAPRFGQLFRQGPWAMATYWPFRRGLGRLMGTLIRLVLLALVASLIVVVARNPVSRIATRVQAEPVKAGLIGFAAEILFLPLLVVTCVVLAISIIGIPLLLLVPFGLVFLVFVWLAGFTGVACAIGEWAARRFGWSSQSAFVVAWIGVVTLFVPLLVARVVGLAGGPFLTISAILAGSAFLFEYVLWTAGFGAALMGAFGGRLRPAPPEAASPQDTSPTVAPPPDTGL